MADLSFADLETRLKTRMRDSTGITFTDAEVSEALKNALYDPHVFSLTRDDSTTTVNLQSTYPIPDAITNPIRIGIDLYGDGYESPIDRRHWDVVDGNIVFDPSYKLLASGKTLFIWGPIKFDENAIVPDNLQPYVLALAEIELLGILQMGLATRFLKNDITMSELIALMNQRQGRVEQLRAKLTNAVTLGD